MASSSTSSIQKSYNYHVFLSFRGEDTRKNIVDHLYIALQRQGIHTFRDNERLEKGKRIDELFKAIEESKYFIIVFSKNYASSSWCLKELAKIMECHKRGDQIAYPVFYDVDPSHIRKQSGQVGKAFAKHKNKSEVGKWKEALEETGNVVGWDLRKKHEGKAIQEIVKEISLKLRSIHVNDDQNLIGMGCRMHNVESYLGIGVDDVRMIGIKGIGGGGKTTLAGAIFDKISIHFEGISFVENVREKANLKGLESLQKQILLDVLKNEDIAISSVHEGKKMMKTRLPHKKVLIVLDDVDQKDRLEALAGDLSWFMPGSRIIITTRDSKVLTAHGVDMVHDVNLMSDEEAICLFSRYAFKRQIPIEGFEQLSFKVVHYAAGLPLTIKVLGSFLHNENKTTWIDALKRLETVPSNETLKTLEISYTGLDSEQKEIFLDVACFMKGLLIDDAIRILESRGFYAIIGLTVLEQKSLITISNQRLGMHDRIEELGRDIVCRMHPNDPSKHTRLWNHNEIKDLLSRDLGTEATSCIRLELVELSPEFVMKGLGNFKKLRALMLTERDDNSIRSDWNFDQGSQYFSSELQFLSWEGYSVWSLPQTFQGINLVGLELPHSRITQLWGSGEGKVLEKLRFLDLSYSKVKSIDLGMTPNIERLDVKQCRDLVALESPDGCLKSLVYLNLIGCSRFKSFWFVKRLESLGLFSLPRLELIVESSEEFPRYSDNNLPKLRFTCVYSDQEAPSPNEKPLKYVSLNLHPRTKLESFSESICGLQHLRQLTISGCIPEIPMDVDQLTYLEKLELLSTGIKCLPDSICMLKHLTSLKLKSCSLLEDLPENLGELECLEKLTLLATRIRHLPESICRLKCLKSLKLKSCSFIERVPEDLGQLECLEKLNLLSARIRNLPDSVCMLKRLKSLELDSCWLLEKLPEDLGLLECLKKLILTQCASLRDIPNSICKMESLEYFHLPFCNKVEKLPEEIGRLKCLVELDIKGTGISHLPQSISSLKGARIFGSVSVLESCDFTAEIQTSETGTFCQIQAVNNTETHPRNLFVEAQRNQFVYTYCNGYFISAILVGALSVGSLFMTQYM